MLTPRWMLAPICLALANVYGPRQNPHGEAGVITGLGSAMITGRPLVFYRGGAPAHDYVYVDDVVEAFVAPIAPMDTSGSYSIGTGQHATITVVHGLIAAALSSR